jgi:hypothetical protein
VAVYRLYSQCEFCDQGHPLPFAVSLELRTIKKLSVGETYNGRPVPRDIVNILKNQVECTTSGNFFIQNDLGKVFIVPSGR